MEWWGWVLVVMAVAIIIPIKLRVWKMILEKAKSSRRKMMIDSI